MLEEYLTTGRRAADIAADVERAVGAGGLAPGDPLPTVRELAARVGVNPHTVAAAYRTLRERGVVETAGRRGTRVRNRPVTTAREQLGVDVPPGVRDVAHGNPDPALLPPLAEAFAAAAARSDAHPVLYGEEGVDPDLARPARAALEADGVPPGELAVTSGSLDAVERVLAAHLRPGDAVAVEDPGWRALLDLVPALGLRPVPVGVDDDGPLPDDAERALRGGARAVVVTCRAQNPTGAVITEERAGALRAVLRRHPGTLLIEDDHGHGIVGRPLHPVTRPSGPAGPSGRAGEAGAGPWVLVRSVSKAYGPDLRLAVLIGDPVTVDRVRGRQRLGPGWVSRLLQRAVAHLWLSGAVDARTVAGAYGRRRGVLLDALAGHGVPAHGRSGMNVWVPVRDETAVVARLLHAGWAVAPGAGFRTDAAPGVRITVSGLDRDDLGRVADAVATATDRPAARRYG